MLRAGTVTCCICSCYSVFRMHTIVQQAIQRPNYYHSSNNAISNMFAVLIILLQSELKKSCKCAINICQLCLVLLVSANQHAQSQQGSYMNLSIAGLQQLCKCWQHPLRGNKNISCAYLVQLMYCRLTLSRICNA